MTTKDQIEIPLSKNKLYLMLAGSLLFVGIGIWMVLFRYQYTNSVFANPVVTMIVGIVSILFFGYIAFFLIKKIPDNTPGLIINGEGIIDNSSSVAAGLVLWSDVQEIKTTTVMNQQFIMIIVKNPKEYIDRQEGAVKRKAMQMNYSSYGSPISISANALNTDFDALYKTVQNKFEVFNVV